MSRLGVHDEAVADAVHKAERRGCAPIQVLYDLNDQALIDEARYHEALADLLGVPIHTVISAEDVDPEFLGNIPISYARRHGLLGLRQQDTHMPIVASGAGDLSVIDHVGALLGKPVRLELAPSAVVRKAMDEAYADCDTEFDEVLDGVEGVSQTADDIEVLGDQDLLDTASRAPVIRLVNMMLFEAVKRRASDVHIQPLAGKVQVRYRIDGVLYDILEVPDHLLDEVASRIKVLGGMDIAEKRIAQDGRTSVRVGDKSVDLRISVIPTSHGERVVIRLLDKSTRLYSMTELGMEDDERLRLERLLDRTHGIILVTGPTGSGKSTTLYAALQHLDCQEKNILTLEDPIEYQLPGISQTQVSAKKGMTFATGLRAVLRQDPDIIMVGEIRDEETARMAIQSSMTGHLVFSTLHTNDAAGAVTRLLDLGIEPFLVASSLAAVLAQRLLRVVCPECRTSAALTEEDRLMLNIAREKAGTSVAHRNGCESCGGTGYSGREGIFELLEVDETIRELIIGRAKSSAIKQRAMAAGMTTLRQQAVVKLLNGQTTVQELSRTSCQDEPGDVVATVEDEILAPTYYGPTGRD